MDKDARDKRPAELAEAMPESAMLVGEMEYVLRDINEALAGGANLRAFLEELSVVLAARIEAHDPSGEARAWAAAWRKAEEGADVPPDSNVLPFRRKG